MLFDHLVLAGGGHTHALMLLRWARHPYQRPKGLITLINRDSTTIYSSMFPGIIAGKYRLEDAQINLRQLADLAGVAFVQAEIIGLNPAKKFLSLEQRTNINFSRISLDLGSGTNVENLKHLVEREEFAVPVRPFKKALKWIELQDDQSIKSNSKPFSVIGSGLAGIEIVFALRKRWPNRTLNLQVSSERAKELFGKSLVLANINLVERDELLSGPALLCTGSKAPNFLESSGLETDSSGRVLTLSTLQSKEIEYIFAVGDCGVIEKCYRPPSGVWAVRAVKTLLTNLLRQSLALKLVSWRPQKRAMQLIGGPFTLNGDYGWAIWGDYVFGPNLLLWKLKQKIDRRFVRMLTNNLYQMKSQVDENYQCRGCAAKLSAHTLKEALQETQLSELAEQSEDAAFIFALPKGNSLIQSVDGFPALISDPWLNARLTTLHSCSDIWATGASVISAQPIVTLPAVSENLQKEILIQVLGGIKSVLEPQGAQIIGGHTLESRNIPSRIISSGIELTISVNGLVPRNQKVWNKNGLQPKDVLLISRPLGSGVLFAASMRGNIDPIQLDLAIRKLNSSQHILLEKLFRKQDVGIDINPIHACTDVTGFGLLGHLNEMLETSNLRRRHNGLRPLQIRLDGDNIPAYPGVLDLFDKGYSSTFAPSNRRFWDVFNPSIDSTAPFELEFKNIAIKSSYYQQIMELIVDPQTCGPLVLACNPNLAQELVDDGPWLRIGSVDTI
tara:strand:+ start:1318 stop:3504 length:2187 start_codon:yes stop_codon:yes gene_type:complete